MGRPLNDKFFGNTADAGNQIRVTAWIPGAGNATTSWIVNQKSNTTYTVSDGENTGRCQLQAGTITGAGQMRMSVMPFGFDIAAGTSDMEAIAAAITDGGTGYSVGNKLIVDGGTFTTAAVLNVDSVNTGVIDGISVFTAGDYSVLPTDPVSTTFGNNDATFNIDWGVLEVDLSTGGAGYVAPPTVTFIGGGGEPVQAAGTAVLTGDSVTSVTIDTAGSGFISPPTVSFTLPAGDVEYARILNAHVVKTFSGNVYKWNEITATSDDEADLDLV